MKNNVELDLKQWDTLNAMMDSAIIEIERSIHLNPVGQTKIAEIFKRDLAEYVKLRDFMQLQRRLPSEHPHVSGYTH